MFINRAYQNQNFLSLQLVSFLVGLRTYQHPCIYVSNRKTTCTLQCYTPLFDLKQANCATSMSVCMSVRLSVLRNEVVRDVMNRHIILNSWVTEIIVIQLTKMMIMTNAMKQTEPDFSTTKAINHSRVVATILTVQQLIRRFLQCSITVGSITCLLQYRAHRMSDIVSN